MTFQFILTLFLFAFVRIDSNQGGSHFHLRTNPKEEPISDQ